RRASTYFLEQPATEALEASALVLNSTSKVLTTSGLYLQKRAVDGLEDGFLFFGQGHHARKLEPVLGVAEINFVHGGQLQQGTLGGELRVAQAILQQGQEQISQVADEDVRVDPLRQPMADGAQLGDAFQTAESLFDDVFVEIQRKHFVLGQRASAEDAGVTIELLDLGQLGR